MPARDAELNRYPRRLACVPASTIAMTAPAIFYQPGRDRLQSPPPAHLALRVPESTGGSALSFRPPSAAGAWIVFLCRPTLLSRLPHALFLGRGFGRCGRDLGIGRS
jgi:hypothetical protein